MVKASLHAVLSFFYPPQSEFTRVSGETGKLIFSDLGHFFSHVEFSWLEGTDCWSTGNENAIKRNDNGARARLKRRGSLLDKRSVVLNTVRIFPILNRYHLHLLVALPHPVSLSRTQRPLDVLI